MESFDRRYPAQKIFGSQRWIALRQIIPDKDAEKFIKEKTYDELKEAILDLVSFRDSKAFYPKTTKGAHDTDIGNVDPDEELKALKANEEKMELMEN